jgi:predicted phosphodiesterase
MRIAYLTDSHLGATADGFHQQPCWVDGMDELIERLRNLLAEQDVELVMHGGDLVEQATDEQINRALADMESLGRPVLICLGNHDLCRPEAIEQWRQAVAGLPRITLADAHLPFDDVDLYALNNHWTAEGKVELFWDPTPPFRHVPAWGAGQLEWLDERLSKFHDRPAMLMVHTQVDLIHGQAAPELDGYITPDYTNTLNQLLDKHPHCRLALFGHCHVTRAIGHSQRIHLTTGAMSEVPFSIRIIDVRERTIGVQTVSLGEPPPGLGVDEARRWVLGDKADQEFIWPLCAGA